MAIDLNALLASYPCASCMGARWLDEARAAILCEILADLTGDDCDMPAVLASSPFIHYTLPHIVGAQAMLACAIYAAAQNVTCDQNTLLADDACLLCYPEPVVRVALVGSLANLLATMRGTPTDIAALVKANPCLSCLADIPLQALIASLMCRILSNLVGTDCTSAIPWIGSSWATQGFEAYALPAQLVALSAVEGFGPESGTYLVEQDGTFLVTQTGEFLVTN